MSELQAIITKFQSVDVSDAAVKRITGFIGDIDEEGFRVAAQIEELAKFTAARTTQIMQIESQIATRKAKISWFEVTRCLLQILRSNEALALVWVFLLLACGFCTTLLALFIGARAGFLVCGIPFAIGSIIVGYCAFIEILRSR